VNPLQPFQKIAPASVPKIDFHMHTKWTDGANTVREMYDRAVAIGMETIAFSEHARSTSGDWFPDFVAEVRALPKSSCKALVGVETKVVDLSGNLDCAPAVLDACDVVLASVHRFPGEKGTVRGFGDVNPAEAADLEFNLAMAILTNKRVSVLAHPFGMCYRRYFVEPGEDRMRALIAKAAEARIAFEINCHYHPDPWKLIQWCQDAGALISLGSNSHDTATVGEIVRVLERNEAHAKH
jgi:histidinol phosphatase-like PHP family hydrolase